MRDLMAEAATGRNSCFNLLQKAEISGHNARYDEPVDAKLRSGKRANRRHGA